MYAHIFHGVISISLKFIQGATGVDEKIINAFHLHEDYKESFFVDNFLQQPKTLWWVLFVKLWVRTYQTAFSSTWVSQTSNTAYRTDRVLVWLFCMRCTCTGRVLAQLCYMQILVPFGCRDLAKKNKELCLEPMGVILTQTA